MTLAYKCQVLASRSCHAFMRICSMDTSSGPCMCCMGGCALVIFNCKATLLQDALHQPGSGVVQRAVAAVQGALPRLLHDGEVGADIGVDLCMQLRLGTAEHKRLEPSDDNEEEEIHRREYDSLRLA